MLPVIGAIADRSAHKKQMLALFAYLGALATMGMFFLQGDRYLLGGGLYLRGQRRLRCLASSSTTRSCRRSPPADERDAVSSRGWALGYLGGGLLLLAQPRALHARESLGLSEGRGGPDQPALGRRLVGAVHPDPAARGCATGRPARRPSASRLGARRPGSGQLRDTLREARAYPHDAAVPARPTSSTTTASRPVIAPGQRLRRRGARPRAVDADRRPSCWSSSSPSAARCCSAGSPAGSGAKRVVLASLVLWTAVVAVALLPAGRARPVPFFALGRR